MTIAGIPQPQLSPFQFHADRVEGGGNLPLEHPTAERGSDQPPPDRLRIAAPGDGDGYVLRAPGDIPPPAGIGRVGVVGVTAVREQDARLHLLDMGSTLPTGHAGGTHDHYPFRSREEGGGFFDDAPDGPVPIGEPLEVRDVVEDVIG